MEQVTIRQKVIIPLFGVNVTTPLFFNIEQSLFSQPLILHLFPEPVALDSKQAPSGKNAPIPVQIPVPKTIARILPWAADETAREEASKYFYPAVLPENFDVFDNLGEYALRSGPGALGGFQTTTTMLSEKVAPSILLIEFTQSYPKSAEMLVGATNPYQSDLIESLLDGIRLFSGGDPHPYKAFHIAEEQLVNTVIKWPLTEILFREFALTSAHLANIKQIFLQIWKVRVASRHVSSCKILTTALEYYYLTSTVSERRTNFMHLMIAFEALFKSREEESASAAGACLAKLIATTKENFNEIRRFIWNTKETPGCCQLRNEIVHGGSGAFSADTDRKLRELIRTALIELICLVNSGKIDKDAYYESLKSYVDQRFRGLQNS